MSAKFTPEELHLYFVADYEQGLLWWRERTPDMFSYCKHPDQFCAAWNSQYFGKRSISGGRSVILWGYKLQVGRVLWAMKNGRWPKDELGSINRDNSDNRLANLQEATRAEINRNKLMYSNNTSGENGVYLDKETGKWRAQIKNKPLGRFDNFNEAVEVRRAAEVELGFSHAHGTSGVE